MEKDILCYILISFLIVINDYMSKEVFSYESISIASCNIVKSSIFMNSDDSKSWRYGNYVQIVIYFRNISETMRIVWLAEETCVNPFSEIHM